MLWRRSRADITHADGSVPAGSADFEGSPSAAPRDTAQEDAAIDTVVAMLKTMGRHPFPVGDTNPAEISHLYDLWAAHLSIGGPHPDDQLASGEGVRPRLPASRDWIGARRFVQARRERECEEVATTIAQSHELIWDMTDRLAKAVLDNRERDREVIEQVEQLREAIATGSVEIITAAVSQAAGLLTGAIKQRESHLQTQLEELGSRVSELSEQLQEVRIESRLDGLTRVPNRADFDKAINRWHHVGSAFGRPTCLILIDLDFLKPINDQYGHRGGDAALRVFANALVRCFPRRSDFVGRYGGDEFAVLLAETPARQGLRLAERFRQYIREAHAEHDGQSITLTASLGLAQLESDETIESWLERADQALYEAKETGRDRVAFARPSDRMGPGWTSAEAAPATATQIMPTGLPPLSDDAGGREAAG
jgi:diguanylate cyclase